MPHSLELPRMLRAVVPLMRSERLAIGTGGVIGELITLPLGHPIRRLLGFPAWHLPRLAAVVRALDDLSEPAAGLRCIDAVRVHRRTLQVVHLPPCKVRTAHIPLLAL